MPELAVSLTHGLIVVSTRMRLCSVPLSAHPGTIERGKHRSAGSLYTAVPGPPQLRRRRLFLCGERVVSGIRCTSAAILSTSCRLVPIMSLPCLSRVLPSLRNVGSS